MKRAEVGNFRVLLDDMGEGGVVIEHPRQREASADTRGKLVLEPGELADLLVALDGVQGDLPPLDKDDLKYTIALKGQEMLHALYRLVGHRMRLELHLETHAFYTMAGDAKIEEPRATRLEARVGNVVLVCERGRRV